MSQVFLLAVKSNILNLALQELTKINFVCYLIQHCTSWGQTLVLVLSLKTTRQKETLSSHKLYD